MKNKISIVNTIRMMLPLYFKYIPGRFVAHIVLSILHGLSFGLLTWGTQKMFDSATLLSQGVVSIKNTLYYIALFGLIHFINKLINGIVNFLFGVNRDILKGHIQTIIFDKISKLPPEDFEDNEKLLLINKAINGQSSACTFVTTFFISIIGFYIPYFVFMGGYLFCEDPILVVSLLFIFVPGILVQYIKAKIYDKAEDMSAPVRRAVDYYEECIVGREYYKETRLLGLYAFFMEKYENAVEKLQGIIIGANKKDARVTSITSMITLIGYLGIVILLVNSILDNRISIGVFASVLASINTMYSIMSELIEYQIGGLSRKLPLVSNFITFINLEERNIQENIDMQEMSEDIVLDNISFCYPHSEKPAIKDVSLTIKQGEKVAIVGENGSGKSTLVRLIMGMYSTTSGSVFYGGRDVKNISYDCLYKDTSAVFQKFQKYQMTVRENVCISDSKNEYQADRFVSTVNQVGLDLKNEKFNEGEDTLLSLEFGNTDLSIGQWQRIAIARGLYRKSRILILDEPTAAIDPKEENNLYQLFNSVAQNKTSIIVTHRLGAAKDADRIVVMSKGQIIQVGRHESLLKCKGEYMRLWNKQSQWYK